MSGAKSLGALCAMIVDSEHKTAPKDPAGPHPLVRTSDLGVARVNLAGCQRVSDATRDAWTRRAIPTANDLILAREAPVGGIGRVPAGATPVLGQRTVLLRPNRKVVDSRWLMYRLAAPDSQAKMKERSSGATVPHLNLAEIRDFELTDPPPLPTQRRIAAVLGAFDELIEINERRIALLEYLPRALYLKRFGECSETSTHSGGPLWRPLEEYAAVHTASVNPRAAGDARFAHYSLPAFDANQLPSVEPASEIRSTKHAVARTSVLWSKLNPRTERLWYVEPADDIQAVASTEFLVLTPRDEKVPVSWIWGSLTHPRIRAWARGSAAGTSTSHQRVRPGDLLGQLVPSPQLPEIESYDRLAGPALRGSVELRQVNSRLAATRDLLLPRLVTGQLDISQLDVDDLIAEVLGD